MTNSQAAILAALILIAPHTSRRASTVLGWALILMAIVADLGRA